MCAILVNFLVYFRRLQRHASPQLLRNSGLMQRFDKVTAQRQCSLRYVLYVHQRPNSRMIKDLAGTSENH